MLLDVQAAVVGRKGNSCLGQGVMQLPLTKK